VTAYFRIAPTAIRNMEVPKPIHCQIPLLPAARNFRMLHRNNRLGARFMRITMIERTPFAAGKTF
jgi:hypothetical protein